MPNEKADQKLCFIVGPIGEVGTPVRKLADWLRDGIIKPVLEADELSYHVKRADEDAAPGSISKAVINDIVNADLVIADLTGFNPNAFYELGIRHALQKPTIHIIAESVKLPFDNADQRTIFVDILDFQSIVSAKDHLRAAVFATQDENYRVSNPVTQAAALKEIRSSGDPRDEILSNLSDRISRIENNVAPAIQGQGRLATMSDDQISSLLRTMFKEEFASRPSVPLNYLSHIYNDPALRSKLLAAMNANTATTPIVVTGADILAAQHPSQDITDDARTAPSVHSIEPTRKARQKKPQDKGKT
ncbi:hypothetical protein [Sphingomonas sanguinis]|uniref:hypothetical protein n=1 Tax=Sphingomonas sanguinis TaxID=33051 RepID=UPI000A6DDE0B|nr:hypothetical protein [Sphingomonas sanguinis]